MCVCQETHLRQLMQKNLAKNLWISRAEVIQQRPSYSVVLMSKSRTTLTQSTDACLQPHRKTTCHEYLTDKFQLLKLTRNDFEVRIRMTPLYSIVITRDSNTSGATSLHLKDTTNNHNKQQQTTTQGRGMYTNTYILYMGSHCTAYNLPVWPTGPNFSSQLIAAAEVGSTWPD